ncbi:MAG: hypothetical protein QM765_02755 [Myxococcales bacterium]
MITMTRTPPRHSNAPWKRFGATLGQWRDWRWQQRHVVTATDLERNLSLSSEERDGLAAVPAGLPVGATPYYLSLADPVESRVPRPHADRPPSRRGANLHR